MRIDCVDVVWSALAVCRSFYSYYYYYRAILCRLCITIAQTISKWKMDNKKYVGERERESIGKSSVVHRRVKSLHNSDNRVRIK